MKKALSSFVRVADSCAPCCSNCPVADRDEATGLVTIHDPHVPDRGVFTLSSEEFARLVVSANRNFPAVALAQAAADFDSHAVAQTAE